MVTPGESLARSLHVLPGLRWLFNLNPVIAVLVLWGFSPGVMWFNDFVIVWGRFIPLSYQWFSALCDFLLAIGIGAMLWSLREKALVPHWLQHWWSHAAILAVGFAASAWHTLAENDSIPTLERRLGPNSVYHNLVLFPLLWYVTVLLLTVTAVTTFCSVEFVLRPTLALVVALACGAIWYAAGVYDGTHQFAPNGVSKHAYANPGRDQLGGHGPWCGGVVTRRLCDH